MSRLLSLLPAAALGLGLSACVPGEPPVSGNDRPLFPTGADDTCGAAAYVPLLALDIGQSRAEPRKAPIRFIAPDSVITMDYVSNRLNVEYDRENKAIRLFCG